MDFLPFLEILSIESSSDELDLSTGFFLVIYMKEGEILDPDGEGFRCDNSQALGRSI